LYSTEIYQYVPRQIVVIEVGSSPRRYDNVYAKTLKLHKGSANRLQFQFLNQEQKPINITGKQITFRLISYDNNEILLQQSLVNTLAVTGIAELRVNANSLNNVHTQKCYYSLELPDELGLNVPGLMDKNGTGRGEIDIVNSVYPPRVLSQELTVPVIDTQTGIYYSSVLPTKYNPKITFQVRYEEFVGRITIQGSTNGTSNWYEIEVIAYTDPTTPVTDTDGYNTVGYHPYIRFQFDRTAGYVVSILAR